MESPETPDIIAAGGILPNTFKKLEDLWDKETVQCLRKLELFGQHRGGWKHVKEPGVTVRTNEKMLLKEVRFGTIPRLNSGKPSIWFVIEHKEDPNGPATSTRSVFKQIFASIDKSSNSENSGVLIDPDIPAVVNYSRVDHETNSTFVLASVSHEPEQWSGIVEEMRRTWCSSDEKIYIRFRDQNPRGQHRHTVWVIYETGAF